jgi:hypothetical protein
MVFAFHFQDQKSYPKKGVRFIDVNDGYSHEYCFFYTFCRTSHLYFIFFLIFAGDLRIIIGG